jgi:transmembrane sensor
MSRSMDEDAMQLAGLRDPLDAAAYWHGVFDGGEPGAALKQQFDAWLNAHPSHRDAYEAVERTWAGSGNAGLDPRVLAMRRDALRVPQAAFYRGRKAATLAACGAALAGIFGLLIYAVVLNSRAGADDFLTQVGERASINLKDGSVVVLNSSSHIHVLFDRQVRRIQLLAGQAWFEVAKNQPRPFVVEAAGQRITAHGTAFDVRIQDHDHVQVTLVEGRVSVETLRPGAQQRGVQTSEELLPGEQLLAAAAVPAVQKRKVDLAKATSWRAGQIIFENDTLAAAIAEVNRYSTTEIRLGDPRLAPLRLSGVFLAGHTDSFLETLTGNFSIQVTPDRDGRLILTLKN